MNPELSFAATASLPRDFANAKARRNVSPEVVTARRSGCHGGNREARGVRREDRARTAQPVELPPEAVLELEVLGHRLDDDVAALQVGGRRGEAEALERGFAVRGRKLALLHELGERLLDARPCAVPDLLRYVPRHRVVASGRGDLRDPASHQTAAQHAYPLDLGHCAPRVLGWSRFGAVPRGCRTPFAVLPRCARGG